MASYYTLPSGSVRATVYVDGIEHKQTRKTQELAEAWAMEIESGKRTGEATKSTMAAATGKRRTLSAFRTEWLPARRVASGTAENQDRYWRLHIEPYLGRIRLCDLTTAKLDMWVNGMIKRGTSAHNIYGAVMHVSGLMTDAGFRGSDNPRAAMKDLPPRLQANRRAAGDGELAAILAASSGQWAVLWELMACTGLRFSEATGLRVSSIRPGHLWIDAVNERPRKGTPGGFRPYTKGKRPRAVPLPPFMATKLAELVAGRLPGAYVFTDARGSLLNYDNVESRQWAEAREAAGSNLKMHELRHTWTTQLIEAGVSPQAVQMAGGWSDMRMLNTYTEMRAGMLATMAEQFEPKPEATVTPIRPRGKRRA